MKELIFFDKKFLKPVGGPAGYLYNLQQELINENIEYIEFLDVKESKLKIVFKKLPKQCQKLYRDIKKYTNRNKILGEIFGNRERKTAVDISKYDIIHFHSSKSMYMVKDSLENYKGKIIFTSHSPKVSYKEIIEDDTSPKEYLKYKKQYDRLEIIDEYAFNRADYIIFPCEEAEEPYFNTWKNYKEVKEKNKEKYLYLPTGIIPIEQDDNSNEIRKKYNIPNNAFVISYVGRHNEVKGYDKLKEIGKKVLEESNNIYFLIAGKEEPIKGLRYDRWIEVGWTNKPYDIVNASNLFILPNKETYFDLVLLEVMSLGKPILLTDTGGNKYYKKFNDSGLFYYDYANVKEAVRKIQDISKLDTREIGNKNKNIFNKYFTNNIFTDKYLEILNEIDKT